MDYKNNDEITAFIFGVLFGALILGIGIAIGANM